MASDGEVSYKVVIDDSNVDRDLNKTNKNIEQAADRASTGTSKLGEAAGKIALGIGAAAVAIGGFAIKAGSEFEQRMSGIKSISGATVAEMDKLKEAALDAGAKTAFSASESAQAIEELMKAGLTTQQVLGGGLAGALDLAAAGEIAVADAAEIASTVLNAFKDDNLKVADAANILAGAANASATDVMGMKLGLSAVSAVASGMGMTFKDTSTALAVFAQNGLKGSDAGTSLKTMLMNLQPATDKQAMIFKQLGLVTADGASKFYDATGSMRPLHEIAGLLQTSMGGLTDAQRALALETMFGSDAIRAGNILFKEGAKGVQDMAKAMDSTTAAEVAKTRLDNFAGSLDAMKGSLETVAIQLYDKLQAPLKNATDQLTESINALGESGQLEELGATLGDLGVILVEALVDILPVVIDLINMLIPPIMSLVELALPPLIELIEFIMPLFKQIAEAIIPAVIEVLAALMDPLRDLLPVFGTMIKELLPPIIDLFKKMIPPLMDLLKEILPVIVKLFRELIPPITELIKSVLPPLLDLFEAIIEPLLELIDQIMPVVIDLFDALEPVIKAVTSVLGPLIKSFASLVSMVMEIVAPALRVVADVMASVLKGAFKDVVPVIEDVAQILQGLIDFVKNVFTGNWSGAWNNVVDIFDNIFSAVGALVKRPINFAIDAINGFISGLNKIKIPDWVPGIGGSGFSLAKIPRLKVGMDYVPSDDFPALLHRGEAVLTERDASVYRSLGGDLTALASHPAAPQTSSQTVIDMDRVGRSIEKAFGKVKAGPQTVVVPVYIGHHQIEEFVAEASENYAIKRNK